MNILEALQNITDHAIIEWENLPCSRIHGKGIVPICDKLNESVKVIEKTQKVNIRLPKTHKVSMEVNELCNIVDNQLRAALINCNANLHIGDKVEFQSSKLEKGYAHSLRSTGFSATVRIKFIQQYEDKILVHF